MTWNPTTDSDLAQAEGWDIFEASGSIANVNGDREFQLQRIDETQVFPGDEEAWHHVYTQAHAGSALHRRALIFLRERSPAEFEAIIHKCSLDGRELNEDFRWI